MTETEKIKSYATEIGFDSCGICKAEIADAATTGLYKSWLRQGYHADMLYLQNNAGKRFDPCLLVENAKSIICVALNYYPQVKQQKESPQFSYYAYGKDYHLVVKEKLKKLFDCIAKLLPDVSGRYFCDTAPVLERYWAAKSGIGFIGKNTLLIQPRKGSFFFLGEIIIDKELIYDKPLNISCGNCTRCIEACPTQALEKPCLLNSNKCISYQTIENKGDIDSFVQAKLGNNIYGCDICQQVCPWNKFALPHKTDEFNPSPGFLELDSNKLENLSLEQFRHIFKNTAVKRAKYEGLKRNIKALKNNRKDQYRK